MLGNARVAMRRPAKDLDRARAFIPRNSTSNRSNGAKVDCVTSDLSGAPNDPGRWHFAAGGPETLFGHSRPLET